MKAILALTLAALAAPAGATTPGAPNLLTYQGRVQESGVLVNGNRDVQLGFCNSLSVAGCPDNTNCFYSANQTVAVSNGLFRSTFTVPASVDLYNGPWYLEVREGAAGGGANTCLAPREQFTSAAYSLVSGTASFVSAAGLTPGLVGGGVNFAGPVGVGTQSPSQLFQVGGGTLTAVAGGAVGVLTLAPQLPLDVNGGAQFGSGATKSTFTAAGGLVFTAGYSPAGPKDAATKAYVDSQVGPSGILATTSTWSAQQTFQNQVTFSSGTSLAAALGSVGVGNASPQALLHIGGATAPPASGPILRVSTGAATPIMHIDSQGFVGIKTTQVNPPYPLSIIEPYGGETPLFSAGIGSYNGNVLLLSTLQDAMSNIGTVSLQFDQYNLGAMAAIKALNEGGQPLNRTAGLSFWTEPPGTGGPLSERLRIKGTGEVGIGTTSPAKLLELKDATAGPVLRLENGVAPFDLRAVPSPNRFQIDGPSGPGVFSITSGGSVGIKTTAPSFALDVVGVIRSTDSALLATNQGAVGVGTVNPLSLLDVNGDATIRGAQTVTSSVTFQSNAFSVGGSTLNVANGKVGIGTNNPAAKLHVFGDLLAGDSTAGGLGVVSSHLISGIFGSYTSGTNIAIGPASARLLVSYNIDNSGLGGSSGIFAVSCDARYSPFCSSFSLVKQVENSEGDPTFTLSGGTIFVSFPFNSNQGGSVNVIRLN